MPQPNFSEYTVLLNVVDLGKGDLLVAASLVEMPGCIAEGRSEAEARNRLQELFPAYCRTLRELGVELPAAETGRGVDVTRARFTTLGIGVGIPSSPELASA